MAAGHQQRRPKRGREDDPRRLRRVEEMLPALLNGHRAPRIRLTDSAGSFVTACLPGGPVLWASRRAIDGNPLAWLGELAHEVAHLLDKRRRVEATIALVAYVPLGIAGVVTVLQPWQVGDHVPVLTVLVGRLIGLLLLCTAIGAIRHLNHRRELRADAQAAEILARIHR